MGTGQRRTTEVGRGLFLVRYVGADDGVQPPLVKITVEPGSLADVEVLLHPDHLEPVLSRPGTCLVVRAMMPGTLGVEVEPRQRNGSIAATVNIEPLNQGLNPFAEAPQQAAPTHSEDLRVTAHVAGIGDVHAKANEWLAGPAAPSRIEGISLEWATKPRGLDIRYSVRTAQPLSISGRLVDFGAFAGTRGRAMALTGLMLELFGAEAPRYQFVVEALFLGSPIMRVTGQRIAVSGPTGREPLVGLRVAVEGQGKPAETSEQTQRQPTPPAPTAARSSGRVRVFRSRPKKGQPAT